MPWQGWQCSRANSQHCNGASVKEALAIVGRDDGRGIQDARVDRDLQRGTWVRSVRVLRLCAEQVLAGAVCARICAHRNAHAPTHPHLLGGDLALDDQVAKDEGGLSRIQETLIGEVRCNGLNEVPYRRWKREGARVSSSAGQLASCKHHVAVRLAHRTHSNAVSLSAITVTLANLSLRMLRICGARPVECACASARALAPAPCPGAAAAAAEAHLCPRGARGCVGHDGGVCPVLEELGQAGRQLRGSGAGTKQAGVQRVLHCWLLQHVPAWGPSATAPQHAQP